MIEIHSNLLGIPITINEEVIAKAKEARDAYDNLDEQADTYRNLVDTIVNNESFSTPTPMRPLLLVNTTEPAMSYQVLFS